MPLHLGTATKFGTATERAMADVYRIGHFSHELGALIRGQPLIWWLSPIRNVRHLSPSLLTADTFCSGAGAGAGSDVMQELTASG
jgi:hypothetical protein